jgi:hypothetical protein
MHHVAVHVLDLDMSMKLLSSHTHHLGPRHMEASKHVLLEG